MAVYNGNETSDIFRGGDARDTMYGNGGNDQLYGGKGTDTLYGGDGNDLIVGGLYIDELWGGIGADAFQLVAPYDSKAWENNYDTINDFSVLEGDKIDLSPLDANARLAGNQAFTFGAVNGEGRVWTVREGADLHVKANISGDRSRREVVEVRLEGFEGNLTATDFIF